jgi:hypothetical protein
MTTNVHVQKYRAEFFIKNVSGKIFGGNQDKLCAQ